jgi:hypothetical protein
MQVHLSKEADMPQGKVVTLYLTNWQKRMVKDYVKSDLRATNFGKVTISGLNPGSIRTYRVPNFKEVEKGLWNLYLSDEQVKQLTEVLDVPARISALAISPEMIDAKTVVFG